MLASQSPKNRHSGFDVKSLLKATSANIHDNQGGQENANIGDNLAIRFAMITPTIAVIWFAEEHRLTSATCTACIHGRAIK